MPCNTSCTGLHLLNQILLPGNLFHNYRQTVIKECEQINLDDQIESRLRVDPQIHDHQGIIVLLTMIIIIIIIIPPIQIEQYYLLLIDFTIFLKIV